MTISIATSDYIKYKEVIIDGVKLGYRTPNSAETLEVLSLQREAQGTDADEPRILGRLIEIFFNLFDNDEKARELLGDLSPNAILDICKRIMESE